MVATLSWGEYCSSCQMGRNDGHGCAIGHECGSEWESWVRRTRGGMTPQRRNESIDWEPKRRLAACMAGHGRCQNRARMALAET